jgi:hypothetical protein
MIYYLPEEYNKICNKLLEHKENESKAAVAACGITCEELGIAVAKQWNFPPELYQSLQSLSDNDLKNKKRAPAKLRVLSDFIRELGTMIQNGRLTDDVESIKWLLDRYQANLQISKSHLKTLVKDSVDAVHQHAQALDFEIDSSSFIKRLSAIFSPADTPGTGSDSSGQTVPVSKSFQLTDSLDSNEDAGELATRNPKEIIMAGIQEISEAMMADHDINDIALMSLEIIYRSLKFHRALLFIRDRNSTKMTVRFGYGRHSRRLSRQVGFQIGDETDLLNLSIDQGKDLIVANARDEEISHLIPFWYRNRINAPAFIFMPLVVNKVCIGAFYADRDKPGQPISETEHRHLNMLRNQLVLAIKYSNRSR